MSDGRTYDEFKIGDLVAYVAYEYSPDYVYAVRQEDLFGVILNTVPGYLSNIMYEVYWFKKRRVETVVVDHIKLMHRAP